MGAVLYWAAFVFAALWLGIGLYFLSSIYADATAVTWIGYIASVLGPSLLVWYIGEAFGYIRRR
jgi:hypothetical protein